MVPGPTSAKLAAKECEGRGSRRADARGPARRGDDRFRAGCITKSFVATVVPPLAVADSVGPRGAVDRHPPGCTRGPPGHVRGRANDDRHLTLLSLLSHTSGLFNYTAKSTGPVPPSPPEPSPPLLPLPPEPATQRTPPLPSTPPAPALGGRPAA
ncbi:hypothetical protein GCM10010331_05130 [Streptomyces xanthochromogenes]|uniref:serine hydrolase n=1 Tax=Streptomyces xanthochromogenes TaxID=67384 RepID=UPI001675A97D|nr:hypothetical protein GCM10010331_05130 [Streptomyces xanthochromogenes]